MARGKRDWVLLAALVLGWLAAARLLATLGGQYLPVGLARALLALDPEGRGLQSWSGLVWIVTTALFLGLSLVLLEQPRDDYGLGRPTIAALGLSTLLAPIVLVLSAYLAWRVALPTILHELAHGGKKAVEQNTGLFGRALGKTPVYTTLVWAVVLTPLGEELIFRGGLWSAVTRLTSRFAEPAPEPLPPELVARGALSPVFATLRQLLFGGGVATLVTAALFAWMHADQQGGAGMIRVVQTACLGLVLGSVRHAAKAIWPGVLLHAGFNLLTIAKARKWFTSPGWPVIDIGGRPAPLPIATLYWQLAAAAAVLLVLWALHRSTRLRRVTAAAGVWIDRPCEQVFDFIVEPDSIPRTFHGHGPIPGAKMAELLDVASIQVGAIRRVHNDDGSVIDERIVELDRPRVQAYRLERGMRPPFSLLVSSAGGRWLLTEEDGGTRVDWTFTFELTSSFLWPIAAVMRARFRTAMQLALGRTQEILEAGREAAPPSHLAEAR